MQCSWFCLSFVIPASIIYRFVENFSSITKRMAVIIVIPEFTARGYGNSNFIERYLESLFLYCWLTFMQCYWFCSKQFWIINICQRYCYVQSLKTFIKSQTEKILFEMYSLKKGLKKFFCIHDNMCKVFPRGTFRFYPNF